MNQKRVLVVDDQAVWRDIVRSVVQDLGYVADEALNPAEAEQLLETEHFDLIISDNWMSGPDAGIGLLIRVKERHIPAILLTTLISKEQQQVLDSTLPDVVPVLKRDYAAELPEAVQRLLP